MSEKVTVAINIKVLKEAVRELEMLEKLPFNPLTMDISLARFYLENLVKSLEKYRKKGGEDGS